MQIDQLQNLLSNIEGCTFASLDTVTVPVLKGGKNNPMQGKIEKHCKGHRVMLFTNKNSNAYESKVRRHLIKEGKNPDSFELGPLPWGQRIPDSPLIEHKGEYYLQCVFLNAGDVEYKASEFIDPSETRTWYSKGSSIPKEMVLGLNERSGSEHQGLEEQVIVRAYKLSSIVALRAFKEELV
jgi:hypothetical protein